MILRDLLGNSTDTTLSSMKWHSLKQSIVKYLLSVGDATIAELSTDLHSSIPTITKAVNELLADSLVVDLGKAANSGGRRPSLYSVSSSSAYFIGVEVNRATISIGAQNLKNELVAIKMGIPFVIEDTEESLQELCKFINNFIEEIKIDRTKIAGTCINLFGRINSEDGMSHNFFFAENPDLTRIISEKINLPVLLENDTRAMAFGEFSQGIVSDEKNVLFLNYGWGIGIGIIINGKLYYGKSGYSGEFGHSSLFDNEILCQCGKIGCLETEVSGWSLVNQFEKAIKEGKKSLVSLDNVSTSVQYNAIISGAVVQEDNLCIDLVTQQSEKMGRYLSILLNLFNPELLIIGGDFSQLGDFTLLPIQAALRKYSLGLVNRDVKLKISALGPKAGVIGACCIVKEKMLSPLV